MAPQVGRLFLHYYPEEPVGHDDSFYPDLHAQNREKPIPLLFDNILAIPPRKDIYH